MAWVSPEGIAMHFLFSNGEFDNLSQDFFLIIETIPNGFSGGTELVATISNF